MTQSEMFETKRRVKQYGMSLVFIGVLALGWFYPLLGYFIPLCMILGIAIGLGRGRKWCDWYCPRGSFYDALVREISPRKDIPELMKSARWRAGALIFFMVFMTVSLILRWPNPYAMGKFFIILLTTTTCLGIVFAAFYHMRFWCSFCPVGSVIAWIGKNKKPLYIDSDACVECKVCSKICPIQLKPYAFKGTGTCVAKMRDCLSCDLCVNACPRHALHR